MGQEKNTLATAPALYAISPNLIVEQLWPLFEAKLREMQTDTGGYVTVKEAAEILRIGEAAVRLAIEEGRLPAKNMARNGAQNAQWRILKSDLSKI